jgi:ABC-type transport system substrate-binding protein
MIASITSMTNEGDNTLHIYFQAGGATNLITALGSIGISKSDHLRSHDETYLRRNPLGTGEYFLYSATDDKIVLKKNQYHRDFRKNRMSPDIAEYHLVPAVREQYQLLIAGDVDFILDLNYTDYLEASQNSDLTIIDRISAIIVSMHLDATRSVVPCINLPRNPLLDKNVRHAIAHAIDIQSYIKYRLFNKAHHLSVPALRSTKNYPVDFDFWEYDIDRARYLMQKAGYQNGFSMRLCSSRGPYSLGLSDFIQRSLSEININVTVDYHDGIELFHELATNPPSAYIRTASTSRAMAMDLASIALGLYYYNPETQASVTAAQNYFRHNVPEILRVARLVRATSEYDPRQSDINVELAKMMIDDARIIPFFQPYVFYTMRSNITWHITTSQIPVLTEIQMQR